MYGMIMWRGPLVVQLEGFCFNSFTSSCLTTVAVYFPLVPWEEQ